MNVQTRPDALKPVGALFPAVADQPIRAPSCRKTACAPSAKRWRAARSVTCRASAPSISWRVTGERDPHSRHLPLHQRGAGAGEPITPAAQWLLDNNYLVEETIYQVKRDLPRRFYKELPTIEIRAGQPRAACAGRGLALCRALRQRRFCPDAEGRRRGLPEGRTIPDRRIVGNPLAAAVRADREPAPHRGAREACARDAADRQTTSPTGC